MFDEEQYLYESFLAWDKYKPELGLGDAMMTTLYSYNIDIYDKILNTAYDPFNKPYIEDIAIFLRRLSELINEEE